MRISYRYEKDSIPNISFNSALIINELAQLQVVSKDELGVYSGRLDDITYYSRALSPALFGENEEDTIPIESWRLFINLFSMNNRVMSVHEDALDILTDNGSDSDEIVVDVTF